MFEYNFRRLLNDAPVIVWPREYQIILIDKW